MGLLPFRSKEVCEDLEYTAGFVGQAGKRIFPSGQPPESKFAKAGIEFKTRN